MFLRPAPPGLQRIPWPQAGPQRQQLPIYASDLAQRIDCLPIKPRPGAVDPVLMGTRSPDPASR
ncbi:MAG: hypothetical protein WDM77_21255 [Steroidobacteraceae bacterium]